MRVCDANPSPDDDDDDDVVFTGQNNLSMQEVCYGHLVATVAAHLLPKPKIKSVFVMKDEWPSIKCTLRREPGKDKKIKVMDPFETYFGNIDAELSEVLAPAMDAFENLRTQPRVLNRRKKRDSWPGQPCSERIKMTINIYGP